MNTTWYRLIADRVAQARTGAGYSKAALAEALGISRQTYQPYERAERPYTLPMLETISQLTGRPIAWLLALDEPLPADESLFLQAYRAIDDAATRSLVLKIVRLHGTHTRDQTEVE
ncbi:MAG: helix-turn-helix transcriptional regulator [Chloroflexi bacterium]|jgi:transcriptional regulator with XRE-family HTH domain|nr:helix-turn-helix transcriptional regulator [Chloroflexota bacterium]